MNLTDFLTPQDFLAWCHHIPRDREQYQQHLQVAYNLKLNTLVPTSVHIETTNFCNQHCYMCSYPDLKRERREMDETLVYKAIDECAAIGVYAVHFFFFGEPFLNKKTIDYMRYAKQQGVPLVATTSNFTAITQAQIRRLVDERIDSIHISFEGLDRQRYAMIRGVDAYDTAKKNIEYLIEYKQHRQSEKPWISLTYVRTDETDAQLEGYKKEWAPRVNHIHISPLLDNLGRPRVIRERQIVNSEGIVEQRPENRLACRQLWIRLCVLSNGEMVPCAENIDGELSLGNIAHMSIAAAWTGEAMRELRAQHIMNRIPDTCVCKHCKDWDWGGRFDHRPRLEENKTTKETLCP